MSKSRKRVERGLTRKQPGANACDVTLDDFANAPVKGGSGRLKKNTINNVVTEVKQLSLSKDRTWDQKLDDWEFHATNKDGAHAVDVKKTSHKKKIELPEKSEDDTGFIYPTEIWFLISDHIRPEDVGVFSAICRDSFAVVHTAKFWFSLYKRYYRKVPDLPERLQPECMVRRYRLRTDVIRALHYMYPPFVNKLQPHLVQNNDPHALTKRVCVLCWYQEKKNQWLFYFKLEKSGKIKYGRNNSELKRPSQYELLEDITANLDKNCKVLQVTCLNFVRLPMISGQVLNGVSMTLSEGMRYHKLQLNFGCGPSPCMNTSNLIVLDPVLNVKILDWWHPLYPHSDGLNSTMYSNETISNCLCDLFDDNEF